MTGLQRLTINWKARSRHSCWLQLFTGVMNVKIFQPGLLVTKHLRRVPKELYNVSHFTQVVGSLVSHCKYTPCAFFLPENKKQQGEKKKKHPGSYSPQKLAFDSKFKRKLRSSYTERSERHRYSMKAYKSSLWWQSAGWRNSAALFRMIYIHTHTIILYMNEAIGEDGGK